MVQKMFTSVSISRPDFSAGTVAEAMFYFGRTDLIVDRGTIPRLLEQIPHETLLRLIDENHIRVIYESELPSIYSEGNLHFFSTMSAGDRSGVMPASARVSFENYYLRKFGITKANRLRAEALAEKFSYRKIDDQTIRQLSLKDALDDNYLKYILDSLLPSKCADRGSYFRTVKQADDRVSIDTDYPDSVFEFAEITQSSVLAHALTLNKQILHSADGRTDLWLDERQSRLISKKISGFMDPIEGNSSNIARFEEIAFDKLSIREAVDSGYRTLDELGDILSTTDARKFKKWLSEQKPSRELISEYHRSIFSSHESSGPFIASSKIAAVAAAELSIHGVMKMLNIEGFAEGAAIVASSIAISGAEGLVDRLIASALAGWRPNQWIAGPANEFVQRH